MTTHKLKIEPVYLDNLLDGRKKVEIRYNDRDYQVGDVLEFTDYRGCGLNHPTYSFRVTHIHSGLGMADNYVALSVERVEKK